MWNWMYSTAMCEINNHSVASKTYPLVTYLALLITILGDCVATSQPTMVGVGTCLLQTRGADSTEIMMTWDSA